jgi:hypothetical protein
VSWNKRSGKWRAAMKHNGKTRTLGFFDDIETAARAYEAEALLIWGKFANITRR